MARVENPYLLKQFMALSTCEVIAKNKATGLMTFLGSLESDTLSQEMSENDIKGGIYNDTYVTVNSEKTLKLEVVDILTRMDMLLNKMQAEMKKGTGLTGWHFPSNYEIKDKAGKKVVELPHTPSDIAELGIYNNATNKLLANTTDYAVVGKEIEIKSTDMKIGDTVFVQDFKYVIEGEVQYGDIGEKSVPQVYELIVRKPLFNMNDEIEAWLTYHIPKAKMSSSFSLQGNSQKDKSTDTTTFTIQKDSTSPYLMRVMFVPEAK